MLTCFPAISTIYSVLPVRSRDEFHHRDPSRLRNVWRQQPVMSRNLFLPLVLLCLLATCALTINGGSSNSKFVANCTGGPFSVAGDWMRTLTGSGGSMSGPGVI